MSTISFDALLTYWPAELKVFWKSEHSVPTISFARSMNLVVGMKDDFFMVPHATVPKSSREPGSEIRENYYRFDYSEGFSTEKEALAEMHRLLVALSKQKGFVVPGTGIEPARYQVPADFESAASASSAIPALRGSP
jgi:hypothetical protein